MRGSLWLLALGCGLMLSASGCCGYMGGCGHCGDTCGGCGGGPVYHRPVRQACGDDCGSCGPCQNDCDPCCGNCCQRNFCFHPFRALSRLLFVDSWCGSRCGGCGSCGDTCDSCGSGGSAPSMGGQYGYTSAPRPGCKNCNRGGNSYENAEMSSAPDGDVMEGDASPEPTPAPTTTKTSRRPSRQTPAYN
jgi:hypothetical protein